MATIFRKTDKDGKEISPYYYGRFQLAGKVYRFSTKETVKSKAETALRAHIAKIKGETSGMAMIEDGLGKVADCKDDKQSIRAATTLIDQAILHIEQVADPKIRDKFRMRYASQLLQGASARLLISDAWQKWHTSTKRRTPSEGTV